MAIPDYTALGIQDVPLVDSWENPDPYLDPLITDMEGGNKRMRTRAGDEVARIGFQLLFSAEQYAIFKNFNLVTLSRGTSRFTMRVWDGAQMITKTVQHASKPIPQSIFPKTAVKLELWVYGGL